MELATIGGAKVLRADDHIGSLEVGKQADICLVGLDGLHLPPLPNSGMDLPDAVAALLVYSATAADVSDVLVAGEVVVRNRRLRTLQPDNIRQRVTKEAAKIRRRAGI